MSDTAVAESGTRLQNFLDRAGLRGFPWKTATILYTISWGWLFIVHDSYWSDDWEIFTEYGSFDFGRQGFAPWMQFEVHFVQFVGIEMTRTIIFAIFFLSAFFLQGVLNRFELLSPKQSRLVILIFLLLPFNSARVSLMVLLYSIPYLVFFLAWYLCIQFTSRKLFLISMVLFFLSFGMHSLLLFYFVPVSHKVLVSKVDSVELLLKFVKTNFVMFVLPVVYWVMRSIFWPEEVAYHDVSLSNLLETTNFVLILGVFLSTIFVVQLNSNEIKQSLRVIFSGVVCIFFGIYAYVVYGFFSPSWSFFSEYIETFLGRSDWYSRHQTLQPLGVALLIVGAIGLLPKFLDKFSKKIQAFILSVCVVFNVGFGFEYVVDHAKQNKIVGVLKKVESEPDSNYQFVDQTVLLNARGRTYRERDWDGLIWLAYGVESMQSSRVATTCDPNGDARLVLIRGPETHWDALKNWVSDGDMGFEVTIDDTPGACKPEMDTSEKVSGAIPILFYFTGAKG